MISFIVTLVLAFLLLRWLWPRESESQLLQQALSPPPQVISDQPLNLHSELLHVHCGDWNAGKTGYEVQKLVRNLGGIELEYNERFFPVPRDVDLADDVVGRERIL